MKISSVHIKNFKRFSNFAITGLPQEAKLVLLVGPNGSGKSSLFDAFIQFYRLRVQYGTDSDEKYFRKDFASPFDWNSSVDIKFHNNLPIHRKSFYIRSAYRNEPDFNIRSFGRPKIPYDDLRVQRTIQNDQSVAENYRRLLYATLEGVYNERNNHKKIIELREELIGVVKQSMLNVFGDLLLNNISDPLADGSFFFQKGAITSFHYKNLSGGEKAAFDLLLDLLIKIRHYDDTVFCIDEPEMHMHTGLQSNLIKEMVSIIPENSQLWLATHSLGVMRAAKEIQNVDPNSVCVLDFEGVNFDDEVTLYPTKVDRIMWEKFLSIALDDLSLQITPKTVVICEGSKLGKRRKDFDAEIYNRIFGLKYPEIIFISGGASNDIVKNESIANVLRGLLKGSKVVSLVDRDDLSQKEIDSLEACGVYTLARRNLEGYLFDDEVLIKLTKSLGQETRAEELLKIKADAISNSIKRGNSKDDIKSAAGEIYVEIKKLLSITGCGNNVDAFMRDTLSPLISIDMSIFSEMQTGIVAKFYVA